MNSSAHVLAIDQGTTSTRAILFDAAGRARNTAQVELTQHYPRPGWVEHDPEEIWQSVVSTCRKALSAAEGPVAAIGLANQRETTVLWERARPANQFITRSFGKMGEPPNYARGGARTVSEKPSHSVLGS